MLKIKLARFGKRNQPHYRIVVNEARSKRDGDYVALLGHYAPSATPKILKIDMEAYQLWITKGAQPTDTVAGLAKKFASGTPFPVVAKKPSKKAKAKAVAEKEAQIAEKAAKAAEKEAQAAAPAAVEVAETQEEVVAAE